MFQKSTSHRFCATALKPLCIATFGCGVLLGSSQNAGAADLTFSFTNPSFGGNPFNSSHLLGLAEIQKQHEEPRDSLASTNSSQSDLFVRQLQSRLLSSLSASLAETITGAAPGDSDTVRIGDQEIYYQRDPSKIILTITNLLDLSETTIEIPVLSSTTQ